MSNTAVTPKAWWVGNIGLGPFQVPIKLVPLTKASKIEFNGVVERQVEEKEGRKKVTRTLIEKVRQQLVDGAGNEIDKDTIKKGYDLGNGQWAVFTPDEIDALYAEQDKKLSVQCFIDASAVDPSLVTRSYHMWPGKNGLHEYRLFMDALAPAKRGDFEKAAVVKFVALKVQYLAVIRRRGDLMALDVLCWQQQVVDCTDVARQVSAVKPEATHLSFTRQIVEQMMTEFDHSAYPDEVAARVEQAISSRAAKEAVAVLDGFQQSAEPVLPVETALERMLADLKAAESNGKGKPRKPRAAVPAG